MKNFPVIVEGETYWVSRSVATAGFVFSRLDGEFYVLANRRGSGTPDFQGFWNCPCGYLDYNESLTDSCIREILEETGIDMGICISRGAKLLRIGINEGLYTEKQNITFRFMFLDMTGNAISQVLTDKYSERHEVDDIKWINIKNVDNYKWAFNHDKIIKHCINTFINNIVKSF